MTVEPELVEKVALALQAADRASAERVGVKPNRAPWEAWKPDARAALAALDQNDLLALLRESLPEDEVAVVLTRGEADALRTGAANLLTREEQAAQPLSTWRRTRYDQLAQADAKLQALLSNSDPGERR